MKLRLLSSSRTAAHISRLATMTLPMSFLFAGCGRKTLPLLKAVGRMQAAKSATSPVKEVLRPFDSAVPAITASPPLRRAGLNGCTCAKQMATKVTRFKLPLAS